MNLITTQQKLTLDFNQKGYKTVIAKQYDKGSRFIPIQCTDNGKALPLDPSYIVQVKMITPDQRAILNTVPIQEDGSLLLELTESMLFYPGKAKAEIRIYDTQSKLLPDMSYDTTNSKLLSTMQFAVLVEPSVFDDDRIIDDDEFNALTELIEKANADYTYVLATAQASADAAQASESNAKDSEAHAAASAGNAANSASIATEMASEAADSADHAAACETRSAQSAASAESSALQARKHAMEAASLTHGSTGSREGEDSDNAQYYYLQSKSISESLAGALRPMGTVTFEDLPPLSSEKEGNMYNISDEFTTTAAFKEGEGHVIPAGANIYKTSDDYWDILAGNPVTGIKGETEASYRRGNVNITREDLGLGNVEDKSSETIRSELTKENVVEALGYTPSVADGTVTGVKGNAETEYRAGDVNITPADIGLENVANERQYSASNPQPSVTGSSGSCTGNAATATALTTNAGSATQPVYFSGGKPVACTSYANASVKYATSAGSAVDQTARDSAANALSVANGKVSPNTVANFASLELSAQLPFIDFHNGNSSADYTSRIIADDNGHLSIYGNVGFGGNIDCTNATVSNVLEAGIIRNGAIIHTSSPHGLVVANAAINGYSPVLASSYNLPSSRLIKENISTMSHAEAQKILDINVVDFDYKEQFGGTKGQHGVIAEDAINIIPSCVVVPEGYSEEEFDLEKGIQNKILSVDYSKFVPYLIKMVQMQQDKINAQQQQIDTLNAHLDTLLNSDSTHSI